MVPAAPIITYITFVFTLHKHGVVIVKSLYFRIFSASSFVTFLPPEIATSTNTHVPLFFPPFIMTDYDVRFIVKNDSACLQLLIPYLHILFLLILVRPYSYQCSLSNFSPISLHMLKSSCLFMYCSFPNIWHAGIMSIVSSNCWHTLNVQLYYYYYYYYYYYICVEETRNHVQLAVANWHGIFRSQSITSMHYPSL